MNQLYFLEIKPGYNAGVLNDMLIYLSDEKAVRLTRYRADVDRKIGVLSEVLIRCLLCTRLNVPYRDIEIKRGQNGKPFLLNEPRLEFNISHTRSAIVAALSDEAVGVDVEKVRSFELNLSKKIFSDNEQAWLMNNPPDSNRRFFEIWTKKEAFLKCDGRGLTTNLKSYDVMSDFPDVKISTFHKDEYVFSVCANAQIEWHDYAVITETELLDTWQKLIER